MSDLIAITEENFDAEVISSDIPVLIDFWAVWCGPCKAIHPIIEKLAKDYDGKVKFAKCDVDSNQPLALKFGIRSIPTLLIFKNGEVVEQIVGAVPEKHIKTKLDAVL